MMVSVEKQIELELPTKDFYIKLTEKERQKGKFYSFTAARVAKVW